MKTDYLNTPYANEGVDDVISLTETMSAAAVRKGRQGTAAARGLFP